MSNWPYFAPDEIESVVQTLQSGKVNYWTGDQCKLFEKEFAAFFGAKYAIALMNGTVALELALYALDIGPGDDVIVTSRTFVASASAVVMRGARPVIADVDLESQNITLETIKAAMTPQTKAIICVHLAGWPCEMDKIMEFAKANNLYVIEDCAQSHGAKYKEKYAGNWGHVAAFSFCQDKIMTTGGEGGMLLTNDEQVWRKAWAYKDHGKDFNVAFHKQHPPGFRWLHEDFGTNWRMTEIQAAIGRKQLEKLPKWTEKRNALARMLTVAFSKIDSLRVTYPPEYIKHAYYKYYVFIKPNNLAPNLTQGHIINQMISNGVPCFSGSCSEIYLENCFVKNKLGPEKRLKNAKMLGETSLMFLVHPTQSESDVQKIITTLQEVLGVKVPI